MSANLSRLVREPYVPAALVTLLCAALILAVAVVVARDVLGASADAALIRRAAQGDAFALRALYDTYSARVLGLILKVVRNRAEAEDLLQDTFVEAWRRSKEFDAKRGDVRGWLFTIARTRALDRLRSAGRAARVRDEVQNEPPPASQVNPPLELVANRQARERISAAMSELPKEQRDAIELAFYEGLTHTEISERTGDPLGTVKTRVRLGMQKLAGLLGELRDGGAS